MAMSALSVKGATPEKIQECLCSLYKHVIENYGDCLEELSQQLTDNINEHTELPPIINLLTSFSWFKAPAAIFNTIRKLKELKNKSDQAHKIEGLIAKMTIDERHGEEPLAEAILVIFTAFELAFINAFLNNEGVLLDSYIKLTAQTIVKIIVEYNATEKINAIETANIIKAIKKYEVHDNCFEKGFNILKNRALPISSEAKKLQLIHIKSGSTNNESENIPVDPRKLLSKAGIVDPNEIRSTGLVKDIRSLELLKPKGREIKPSTYKYYFRLPFEGEDLSDLEKMSPPLKAKNCAYEQHEHFLWSLTNKSTEGKTELVKMMMDKLPHDWKDATEALKELKQELISINSKLNKLNPTKIIAGTVMVKQTHTLDNNKMEKTKYDRTQTATAGTGSQTIVDTNNTMIGCEMIVKQE